MDTRWFFPRLEMNSKWRAHSSFSTLVSSVFKMYFSSVSNTESGHLLSRHHVTRPLVILFFPMKLPFPWFKTSLYSELSNSGTGCLKGLWSLHPWRSSKLSGCGSRQKDTFLHQLPCNLWSLPYDGPPLMVFVNILESLALLQEAQSCSRALHNTLIHAASNALLIFWPTAIQKKLCSAFYEKAQKAFKYLNGKLHSASCSQTILDTNSALSKLSKTVSLQLHYILSTPWNRDSLAQLWFTLFWARFIETRNFLCII